MAQRILMALAAAVILTGLTGCKTEPVTGRHQLMLMSSEQETTAGAQAYQEVLSKAKISTDAVDTKILRRVGQRIAAVANQPSFQWEFNLIESSEANAFCLPGGKVAVYTGLLPICQNEAGLAAVVGHEVGHAIAHHGNERMSQATVAQLAGELLQAGTGGRVSPGTQQALMAAYGVGANVGVLLPFSRTQEKSADEIGMDLMAKAGYDPAEAVKVWDRMAAQEQGAPPEILSTHPATKNRIADLQSLIPKMEQLYQQSPQKYGAGEPLHTTAAR